MTRPQAFFTSQQIFLLDFLRAMSAQMVLLGHGFDFFGILSSYGSPEPGLQIQQLGVVLFFILSGLLITGSAYQNKRDPDYQFKHFVSARFVRIYSAYLPALVIIFLIDLLPFDLFKQTYLLNQSLWVWLGNALMLQEYPWLQIPFYGSGFTLWSLGVEWWLYIGFGLLFFFRQIWFRIWFFPLLLIAGSSAIYNSFSGTAPGIVFAWLFGSGIFFFLLRYQQKLTLSYRYPLLLAVGLAIMFTLRLLWLPAQMNNKAYDPLLMVLLSLIVGSLLVWAGLFESRVSTRLKRIVRYAANYSYTLYLIHFSILAVLFEWRDTLPPGLLLFTAVLFCNGFAAIVGTRAEWRLNWRSGKISRLD